MDQLATSEFYEIPIEIRALRTASVYVVRTESNTFLVDSGMRPSSVEVLEGLGVDLEAITGIIISHLHIDHIGGAMAISRKYGSRIVMGKRDAEFCRKIGENHDDYINFLESFYRSNGMHPAILDPLIKNHPMHWEYRTYLELEVDQMVEEGSRPLDDPEIEILMTPGHSPGSISPYIPGQEVFVGDHVLKRITPNISFYDERTDMLSTYIASLDRLRDFNFKKANPGHGEPFYNLNERIDQIKEHHRHRLEEILGILEKEYRNAFDVTLHMKWSRNRSFDSMNEFERNFAFGEAVSHLRKLEHDGLIEKRESDGVIQFRKR